MLGQAKDDRAAGFESCQDRLDNTRSWHFEMFQMNGDANSKVRKKHVRERIIHSNNARNIRRDCRESAVTRFQKNE